MLSLWQSCFPQRFREPHLVIVTPKRHQVFQIQEADFRCELAHACHGKLSIFEPSPSAKLATVLRNAGTQSGCSRKALPHHDADSS
jgi:hypothetical protein